MLMALYHISIAASTLRTSCGPLLDVHIDSLLVHPLIRAILRVSGFRRFFSKRSNGTRIRERLPSRCCMQISLPPSRHTARRREYESCCAMRGRCLITGNPSPYAIVQIQTKPDAVRLYPALQLFFYRSTARPTRAKKASRLARRGN